MTRQLLRITTAGSVDDGKSTLIGRLLHDTDSLPLDHLEAVTDEEGVADLAALSDGLRAEREQGIHQQDRGVCVGSSGEHVAGVPLVAGGVGEDVAAGLGGEEAVGDIDGDALFAFRAQPVGQRG